MADTTVDGRGIGPQLTLDDVVLPPAVGERLATLFDHDGDIETAGEWIAVEREALVHDAGRMATIDDLCTTDDGAHIFSARDGSHEQAYICVLDPLVYPVLTDTPGTVRSETPVRGETVEIEVSEDGASVSHDDAVVSIGVSDHVDAVDEVTPEVIYRQICGYIHVFVDETEYAEWAEDVDAATTALPVSKGLAVAGELTSELFE